MQRNLWGGFSRVIYTRVRRNYIKTCHQCGGIYSTHNAEQKTCSLDCKHDAQRLPVNTCEHCGGVAKPRRKYCSKECRRAASALGDKACRKCGATFFARRRDHIYCSVACQHEALKNRAADKVNSTVIERVECPTCNVAFTPSYSHVKFCSKSCQRRFSNRTSSASRRARKRKNKHASFDPVAILERDQWHCQICGKKTPKKYRGTTRDNAPEVDHIVPLSLGGSHLPGNCQCTCRSCNLNKRATVIGQLDLLHTAIKGRGAKSLINTDPWTVGAVKFLCRQVLV